jgi:hypothetical protein
VAETEPLRDPRQWRSRAPFLSLSRHV